MAEIDEGNAAQAAEWDGPAGAHRTKHAALFDAELQRYHDALLTAATVGTTDRVLDIGCGTGQSTRAAARAAVSGSVLGVDLSTEMLALATDIGAAQGLHNITHIRADAQTHPFPAGAFDVAISQFGAMFFANPVAAFTNIARALRPAGRLAMLTWQPLEHQEWSTSIRSALSFGRPLPQPTGPGGYALSDPAVVRDVLTAAGFTSVELTDLREPLYYGPTVDAATELVLGMRSTRDLLADLTPTQTTEARTRLHTMLTAHQRADGVWFNARAWLTTASR